MRPCTAWFVYSKVHIAGRVLGVIRNHFTGTKDRNISALFIHRDQGQTDADRGEERGWGVSKKCQFLLICDLLKSLCELSGSVRAKAGRGSRSFSAQPGTNHTWLTLWICTEPMYMLFSYPILKVCQSQSLCLFQLSLTSMCVHVTVHVFGKGKPPGIFLMHWLLHIIPKQHSRVSLGSTVFLSNVFCAACSSRGLIMLGLKAQTPPCQRQTINHTQSLVGKYAFFFFWGLGNTT